MKPASMTQEEYDAHVKASQEQTKRRAAVEANPTDVALDHEARIAALESKSGGSSSAPKAPKAAKAKK